MSTLIDWEELAEQHCYDNSDKMVLEMYIEYGSSTKIAEMLGIRHVTYLKKLRKNGHGDIIKKRGGRNHTGPNYSISFKIREKYTIEQIKKMMIGEMIKKAGYKYTRPLAMAYRMLLKRENISFKKMKKYLPVIKKMLGKYTKKEINSYTVRELIAMEGHDWSRNLDNNIRQYLINRGMTHKKAERGRPIKHKGR